MYRKQAFFAVGVFLSIGLFLSGCGLFGADSSGRFILRLTDAPLEAEAVTVSIVACELIDSASGERETVELDTAAVDINLLDYRDGVMLLVADAEVQLQRFDQFRLRIGDDPTITVNGETYPIHIASGASSGVKFFLDAPLELDGGTVDVTLDFDAAESVVPLGSPNSYVMTPVIKPVTMLFNSTDVALSEGQVE